MLAVVLAAGKGKRLAPLTDDRSKAMMPVAGTSMLERVLTQLAAEGATGFIVVAHPQDAQLASLLRRPPWHGRVRLAVQRAPQGMAAALACATPMIREEAADEFLLAACDNLFPEGHVKALAAHRRAGALDAALTLLRVRPEEVPFLAVVRVEGERVTGIVEKPLAEHAPSDLGSVALYALSVAILDTLPQVPLSPRGEHEFQDALRLLIAAGGRVGGLLVASRMTLTTADDLLRLNRHFLRSDPACAVVEADVPPDAVLHPPVRIEAGARVGPGSRIGPEVYLESGSRVGEGVRLREVIALRGAEIPSGADLHRAVVPPGPQATDTSR